MFDLCRRALVLLTGRGYDRSAWMNNLHHKLAYRLHRMLPSFGITGIQRVPLPGVSGMVLFVRAEDGGVAHQLLMYRQYEPFESSLLRARLNPGMTVYNIGANIGYYALLTSLYVRPTGTVFAFEPAPENFALLEKNIAENAVKNVVAVPMAVGAEVGTAMLAISATNSGDHQLRTVDGRSAISVPVTTLDTFIAENHPAPDAIIMDVQGSELDVLQGATRLLASASLRVLFMEFWPKGLDERNPSGARKLIELLVDAGFSLHVIDEKMRSLNRCLPEELLLTGNKNVEINLLAIR